MKCCYLTIYLGRYYYIYIFLLPYTSLSVICVNYLRSLNVLSDLANSFPWKKKKGINKNIIVYGVYMGLGKTYENIPAAICKFPFPQHRIHMLQCIFSEDTGENCAHSLGLAWFPFCNIYLRNSHWERVHHFWVVSTPHFRSVHRNRKLSVPA